MILIVIGVLFLLLGWMLIGFWPWLIYMVFFVMFMYIMYLDEKHTANNSQKKSQCKLKFLGMKVTGPIDKFEDELISKGWSYGAQPVCENTTNLIGNCYGRNNVALEIEYTCKSKSIMTIKAIVSDFQNAEELQSFGNKISEAIGKKTVLGKPTYRLDYSDGSFIEALCDWTQMIVSVYYYNAHNIRLSEIEKKKLTTKSEEMEI